MIVVCFRIHVWSWGRFLIFQKTFFIFKRNYYGYRVSPAFVVLIPGELEGRWEGDNGVIRRGKLCGKT